MKKLPITLLAALAMATATHAQTTVSSDPVGFNTITALGNSDTRFSLPLHRASAYQGAVASVAGNVLTVQGTPGWTANQFVYSAGTQSNTYYVEITSGSKAGMFYTVLGNSSDSGTTNTSTLTLDLNGDTTFTPSSVQAGNTLKIIPYWTLGTLFPNGQGITGTGSIFGTGAATKVLVTDASAIGTNLGATQTYYFYTGASSNGPGWRKIGGGLSTIKNDDYLLPDTHVLIRQDGGAGDTKITVAGAVPVSGRSVVLGTYAQSTDQDNYAGVDIPIPMTLAQSGLATSAFLPSNIFGTTGDQVLVFDDSVVGMNKGASATYYYFNGTTYNGPGWRKIGGGFTNIFDNTAVFQPGSGVIIRKRSTGTPSSVVWNLPLPY